MTIYALTMKGICESALNANDLNSFVLNADSEISLIR